MRILFSSTPAFGHLLPMLPLAVAALRAGHDVAVLTNAQMTAAARPLRVLPAGPTLSEVMAEVVRSTGSADQGASPEAAYFALTNTDLIGTLAQYFAGARVNLGQLRH